MLVSGLLSSLQPVCSDRTIARSSGWATATGSSQKSTNHGWPTANDRAMAAAYTASCRRTERTTSPRDFSGMKG